MWGPPEKQSGAKSVEGRLNAGEALPVKVGSVLRMRTDPEVDKNILYLKVNRIHHYPSFAEVHLCGLFLRTRLCSACVRACVGHVCARACVWAYPSDQGSVRCAYRSSGLSVGRERGNVGPNAQTQNCSEGMSRTAFAP